MITNLFPTPIYSDKLNLDNLKYFELIRKIKENDPGVVKSNMNGWHSDSRINILELNDFKELKKEISKSIQKSIEELGYQKIVLKFLNSWSIITPKGGSNSIHNHSNSFLSGAYYLQANNASPISFYDPREIKVFLSPTNVYKNGIYTSDIVSFMIESGFLILFPSWLKHSVSENKSDSERIIVSFNLGVV